MFQRSAASPLDNFLTRRVNTCHGFPSLVGPTAETTILYRPSLPSRLESTSLFVPCVPHECHRLPGTCLGLVALHHRSKYIRNRKPRGETNAMTKAPQCLGYLVPDMNALWIFLVVSPHTRPSNDRPNRKN